MMVKAIRLSSSKKKRKGKNYLLECYVLAIKARCFSSSGLIAFRSVIIVRG
jgi:hypothetical protein